ncbi:hypothetical protein HYDPIDRAFT_94863 [Hydnomerulius pinastri MD-312]|uniref:Chromo domain-containing protein n=1 Tax=Hydnomerulius pinastri MD-312 TaxID=994086 RepID=A0A0C9W652_9AGAM|nr:hypothetical protein HYDPIDRAFT_94863 [Hydnomerulius pinastri MD-312]
MSSDEESAGVGAISERETQFVPRSDDDDVLWEVQEITAERGKKYKVKWLGDDPATGKPWPQSWVDKHDCTDQLVAEWMAKKKAKAKQKRESTKKRGEHRASVWTTKPRRVKR